MTSNYGLMAEFEQPERLMAAVRAAYAAGYRKMDAYSPFPIEGLSDALGFRRTLVPMIVLAGGILGCAGGFLLQVWAMDWSYPLNVGHRPLISWPAFIPVTFELTILAAAFAAVLGMLALNGLPRPHHPVFNVDRFALASRDRFFLYVEARDVLYEPAKTRAFLESLHAKGVYDVPA